MSLVYIGIVVLLHIYSKMTAVPVVKPEGPETASETQDNINPGRANQEGKAYTEDTL